MRLVVVVALFAAAASVCLLGLSSPVIGSSVSVSSQAEIAEFVAEQSRLIAAFDAEFDLTAAPAATNDAQPNPAAPAKSSKPRAAGSVRRGGRKIVSGLPDFSQGKADGTVLPPFDPFGMDVQHQRMLNWKQKRRQRKAEKKNLAERARSMQKRANRRIANEKREAAESKKQAAAELKENTKDSQVETELVELRADAYSDTDLSTSTDAAVDSEAELAAESEANLDAKETATDFAAMTADINNGGQVDVDVEAEVAAEQEEQDAQALVEKDAKAEEKKEKKAQIAPLVHNRLTNRLHPSAHITYGRESLSDEQFDNNDSRAVFSRRARGHEIVRSERRVTSSGGQAVVNGVTRTPCGKEITDKGLFGAVVLSQPGATIEAANPEPPVLTDQNLPIIKKLPITPQFKEKKVADQYGDM